MANDAQFFSRFQAVVIVVPGAALLLALMYLQPNGFGAISFDIDKLTLGALGVFSIVSLVAGEVIQAFFNLIDPLLNWVSDRTRPSPIDDLSSRERQRFFEKVQPLAISGPQLLTRRLYRTDVRNELICLETHEHNGVLPTFLSIAYGLNRALALVTGLALLLAILNAKPFLLIVALCIAFCATSYRAIQFNHRYEAAILRSFLDPAVLVKST
jgi:hypothetical protein